MAIGIGLLMMIFGQGLLFAADRSSDPHHSALCFSFGWAWLVVGLFVVGFRVVLGES